MFLPVREGNFVDFADILTGTVPVTGGPLGNSIILELFDLFHVGRDMSKCMNLPVGVSNSFLDDSFLVLLGLFDVCVFGVAEAEGGVFLAKRLVGQDDIFGGGPVLALECCNELVGISINLCIIGHALHHLSLDIHVGVKAIDDSSSELSGAVHRRVGGVLSSLHKVDGGGEHFSFVLQKNYYNFYESLEFISQDFLAKLSNLSVY